jgi:hypothetical protein
MGSNVYIDPLDWLRSKELSGIKIAQSFFA